jgi:hypothetical protein
MKALLPTVVQPFMQVMSVMFAAEFLQPAKFAITLFAIKPKRLKTEGVEKGMLATALTSFVFCGLQQSRCMPRVAMCFADPQDVHFNVLPVGRGEQTTDDVALLVADKCTQGLEVIDGRRIVVGLDLGYNKIVILLIALSGDFNFHGRVSALSEKQA